MPEIDTRHDVVVIGCGVAGLAAARRLAQGGAAVATLEAMLYGGLITNVNALDGEIAGSGAEFAGTMMGEVLDLGVEHLEAQASAIERGDDGFVVASDGGRHGARAVIVASGARLKPLCVPGETAFEDKGVSHCADCDGPLLAGRDVAVVGGGDSALQSALVLAQHCRAVHLIHHGDACDAQPHLVEAVAATPAIVLHRSAHVRALVGGERLEAIELEAGGSVERLPVDAVFAYVGLEPATDFCPPGLARDANGRLVTDASRRTAIAGLYAAGAVRAGCGGTLRDAIDDGEAAALAVLAALPAHA